MNHFFPYYAEYSENVVANYLDGLLEFETYFGDWYIRKVLFANPSNMKSSFMSLKKFYKFLCDLGYVCPIDYKFFEETINENKERWILMYENYENGYFDEFDSF